MYRILYNFKINHKIEMSAHIKNIFFSNIGEYILNVKIDISNITEMFLSGNVNW